MSPRNRNVDGTNYIFSECIVCGITYSIPATLWNRQRTSGGYHHCPNGHSQGWNQQETVEAQLRRERDIARQQIARVEDEAREARERAIKAEEMARKAERATQRLKKRTAAGTCPCCQRTFQNMSVHMRKQHPDFVGENVITMKKMVS